MGKIPVVTSQISANSGRTSAGIPSPRASANAFGGDQAQAYGVVGSGLDKGARGLDNRAKRQAAEQVANKVAQADFTATELELRNQAGPGATGYQKSTLEAYDGWVQDQAEDIEDDEARVDFIERMNAKRPSVSSRSAQYEFTTANQYGKDQANASLVTLDNKLRLDPNTYDEVLQDGFSVLDSQAGLNATQRSSMKEGWRQAAALSRFEGMLEGATTQEDVRVIQAELADTEDRDWSGELSQAGLERVKSLASAAGKAIQTKADADARAAIGVLEERAADVTADIPQEELRVAQEIVGKSENPLTQARLARIIRDQQVVEEARKLTPAQQRLNINQRYNNPSLPAPVNSSITEASQAFGISPAYLAATAQREYGQYLKGHPAEIDYGKGNAAGASSATGVMQIIDSTFLNLMARPEVASAIGVDTTGMSQQEILDLRKDPRINIMAGAAYAKQNNGIIKRITGRDATDAELYMAHFMGGGGVSTLLKIRHAAPDTLAADAFPAQAEANPTIFYNKDGSSRTVNEVYEQLGSRHGTTESYVEYGDRETRNKVLEDTEAGLQNDPMDFASRVGNVELGDPFSEGGMEQRGEHARAVADYYSIPIEDMKPFTEDDAAHISKVFSEGSADDVLDILSSIEGMGGGAATAAMKQIGSENEVLGYAGGLSHATGQRSVASDVVRGQKRLDENPDVKSQIGATREEMSDAFLQATGGALFGVSPQQRQSISDAAVAHYVETQVARGKAGAFDREAFNSSVQAVLGATEGSPAIEEVNGRSTILPPGVTGEAMEDALSVMTMADWSGMSASGTPPRYVTGVLADPEDLADEAVLQSVGGGGYRVMTSDGSFLITGAPGQSGRLEAFILRPTAKAINNVIRNPTNEPEATQVRTDAQEAIRSAMQDGLTSEEMEQLSEELGENWMFDVEDIDWLAGQ